jgi:hypothetical protein
MESNKLRSQPGFFNDKKFDFFNGNRYLSPDHIIINN